MFAVIVIIERLGEMQRTVYLCSVEIEKVFDTVKHEEIVKVLKKTVMDGKDTKLTRNLYWNKKFAVRVDNEMKHWIEVRRGVSQSYLLSPDLFSLYSQVIIDALEDLEGISHCERNVKNIRYADYIAFIVDL